MANNAAVTAAAAAGPPAERRLGRLVRTTAAAAAGFGSQLLLLSRLLLMLFPELLAAGAARLRACRLYNSKWTAWSHSASFTPIATACRRCARSLLLALFLNQLCSCILQCAAIHLLAAYCTRPLLLLLFQRLFLLLIPCLLLLPACPYVLCLLQQACSHVC
jgi:hypothetical protein